MRTSLFFLVILFLVACANPKTIVSCPGDSEKNKTTNSSKPIDASKDPTFFKKKRTVKGQDGFRVKQKRNKRPVAKAEGGQKKIKKETKISKKIIKAQKQIEIKRDPNTKAKANSRKNVRQQRTKERKRKRHPEKGLFPKGHPG